MSNKFNNKIWLKLKIDWKYLNLFKMAKECPNYGKSNKSNQNDKREKMSEM